MLALCWIVLGMGAVSAAAQVPVYGYRVVTRLPHSTASYTEGFFYKDGLFYEGTGLAGRSQVLVYRPATGEVVKTATIPPQYFGEGIIDWGPYLYEWTWQSHVGFIYDRRTLRQVRTFTYAGEGWGMTRTTREIVTSDGSAILTFRDPRSFQPVRSIVAHDGPVPITMLNELEFVKGEIYANIWHTDRIARIAPADGHVIAYIDLSGLRPASTLGNAEAVLNGIAYDREHNRLFVTGKQWPTTFEIELLGPKKLR